jgi:xanthine/uracil permease
MIPRGEVVLFFAGVGASLFIIDKAGVKVPVISGDAYSAVVIMVIVTTLMTPPLLKWALDSELDRSEIDNKILRLPSEK